MTEPDVTQTGQPTAAALPREVYRLRGPGLEVVYQRGDAALALVFSEEDYDHLSGTRAAVARTEDRLGARVDAELLFSRGGLRIVLTLLLPEADHATAAVGEPVEVTGVAVRTRVLTEAVASVRKGVLQDYVVTPLAGTMTLEV